MAPHFFIVSVIFIAMRWTRQVQRIAGIGDAIRLALGAGLAAGYADVLALEVRRLFVEPLVFVGHHVWWTAPVATAALFLVLLCGVGAIGLAFRSLPVWRVGLWLFLFLAVFGVLYTFPQFHRLAAIALSAGVATAGLRWTTSREPKVRTALRLIVPGLAILTVGTAGVLLARDALAERRAIGALPTPATETPNVLLIVLDTVRAMNLSLYGYARETTPALDRWAGGGVTFERAYATAPWTLSSHASILTGRWMHELSADWMVPLDGQFPTLAEVLASRGYLTGGFVANTDYCSREVGLNRGFGHYEDYTLSPGQILRSSALWRALARIEPIRAAIGNYDNLGRKTAPDLTRAFLHWVDRRGDRPFFAFLNYYDAHRPYLPPEPFASRFRTPGVELHPRYRKENGSDRNPSPERVQGAIDAYDNAITWLDAELAHLFDELDRRGLGERTLIVVTSDHGEEFMEHGAWDHGNTLYGQAVHVPLVVRWPGRVPARARVAEPVSLRDIPATLMQLLPPAPHPFPGRSLSQHWVSSATTAGASDTVLMGVRQVPRQPFWYPVARGHLASAVAGDFQYIRNLGDGAEELFDLARDPEERTNLAGTPAAAPVLPPFRLMTERMFGAPEPAPR